MDELVHHCVRELAFDGDLGCNASRLRDFIIGFYNVDATHSQRVDDAFCAFVWSLIAQQPTVRVGTMPPGSATEVFIAPQTSAKRKAAQKGEEVLPDEAAPALNIIPNATAKSLEDLKAEHGDELRIAVDPETCFAAITGSHIRPSKLSPMVYTALQLITRGREHGISVVDLGKDSKYDQKTCFYLVKQLVDLDLVVKRRKSGLGTNFVIHKYFYERDRSWQLIHHEEAQAADLPAFATGDNELALDDKEEEDAEFNTAISFEPIDTRHMSSLPLIRARVLKLLQASENNMYLSQTMLVAIGFRNPTRLDRRFFQARLRELIAAGDIERVSVTNPRKPHRHIKCIRLVSSDANQDTGSLKIVVEPETTVDEELALEDANAMDGGIKMNVSLQRQITDLLEEAGTRGLTLIEISASLGNFDKRTIELLLIRGERTQPPAHLSDLGTAGLMETFGREHRHRYFTMASYRAAVAKEGLDDAVSGYAAIDFSVVGGFAPIPSEWFYEDEATINRFADTCRYKAVPGEGKAGSKPKKARVNPILPDGSVKLGRPRKHPEGSRRKGKRKRDEDGEDVKEPTSPAPKRGRPPKKARIELSSDQEPPSTLPILDKVEVVIPVSRKGISMQVDGSASNEHGGTIPASPSKKRGRSPIKPNPLIDHKPSGRSTILDDQLDAPVKELPRKRGRPSKNLKATVIPPEVIVAVAEEPALAPEKEPAKKRGRPSSRKSAIFLHSSGEPSFNEASDSPHREESAAAQSSSHDQASSNEPRRSPRKRKRTSLPDGSLAVPTSTKIVRQIAEPVESEMAACDSSIDEKVPGATAVNTVSSLQTVLAEDALESISNAPLHTPQSQALANTATLDNSLIVQAPTLEVSVNAPGSQPHKPSGRAKLVNVSHLRRESELYRLLEECGGMMNTLTKEFYDAHADLVEALSRAGEPTSAPPGIRLDKRTAASTLDAMASRGRIKIVKTTLFTTTGASRPATVVYLPDIEQDTLDAFLANLGQNFSVTVPPCRRTSKTHEDGESSALPLQLLQMEGRDGEDKDRSRRNEARADQLFEMDDATIRQVLLAEKTTLSQMYGFIVGKAIRARCFHLASLNFFERNISSSRIVSAEARIVDFSFFYHDFTMATFCAVIGAIHHDEAVDAFMKTSEGQATPVAKIPPALHNSLQIGRARTRTRLLDLLEFLRSLDLVVPLRPSTSSNPMYTCEANGRHPTAFDIASLDDWATTVATNAPTHWHFTEAAPIHLWSQSDRSPSFWKDVSVKTVSEAEEYWRHLAQACKDTTLYTDIGTAIGNSNRPSVASIGVAKSIRRQASWNDSYLFTWHQEHYLRRFMHRVAAESSGDQRDGGEVLMQKICWVVSAPRASVERFLEKARKKALKSEARDQRKQKQMQEKCDVQKAAEVKALLQRKAAEAKSQRETDWETLLHRVYPYDLASAASSRMRRVRARFLQSAGNDVEKWEGEIAQAIRDIKINSKGPRSKTRSSLLTPLAPFTRNVQLPQAVSQSERSVQSIIAQQRTPPGKQSVLASSKRKVKSKGDSAEDNEPKILGRRGRFHWNRDYDELARDASAVIRARCRDGTKLDWSALSQVFPAVPRNSVRQRIVTLRAGPGAAPYLQRLEDRWYAIWSQYRGTDDLPDSNINSPSDFDLIKHVEFLRKYIDKNALRVGLAAQFTYIKLPASIDEIQDNWNISEKLESPIWEFMWSGLVDEGRERGLLVHPFTLHAPASAESATNVTSEEVSVAEAAVKRRWSLELRAVHTNLRPLRDFFMILENSLFLELLQISLLEAFYRRGCETLRKQNPEEH
ncbi:hypothetical protein HWV62_8551 [Athelia sp. TMB]|nr:hypothetical protein HWV62_8551 [Athelia sp. TMB]